jgi:large subunit ribosomal protein L18e
MKYGPENADTITLLKQLEHAAHLNKAPIWTQVAKLVKMPRRKRVAVNLAKITKLAKEGCIIVVPGRLLSLGTVPEFSFTLAVQSCSEPARAKLAGKKVKLVTIKHLVEQNPKGSNVRIVV